MFRLAVARPIATLMIFIAILVLGVYAATNLPLELFPEINPPNISVITTYPGAGALEVEQNVTEEIEDQLSTISNLEEITSNSVDNLSVINLEFTWETDLDEASNEIRDAIGRVREVLPDDAEDPVIFKFSASTFPVIVLAATAEESFPNLRTILENKLVDPLNRIDGVGNVSMQGGPERTILVELNPTRLQSYNLDPGNISQVLAAENITIPAGDIEIGKLEYNLRIDTEYESLEDIRNLVIANQQNRTIYLKNIATVTDTLAEQTRIQRVNGKQGVSIVVQKQSNANTVNVANSVQERLPALEAALPADVAIRTIVDTSDFIVNSISNLQQVLIYAIVFVVLVVLFFLKRKRATFIVALTIPFSLIGAFIYLSITGNSLNLISLSSLSIALGMVVDDAIVVFENISKKIEAGSRPKDAAVYGTGEVGLAVVATTLTVVAVFFPLTFLSGLTGIWFQQLGYIVCVTIIISTLAALSLIPMLSSVLLKKTSEEKPRGKFRTKLYDGIEKILSGLDNHYQSVLMKALAHKRWVLVISILIFIGSFFLVPMIGTEFMPERDSGQISVNVELATGRNLDQATQVIDTLEKIFERNVPELVVMTTGAGTEGSGQSSTNAGSQGTNIIDVTARLVPVSERERSVFTIAEVIREELDDVPMIINYSVTTQGGGGGQQQSPIAIDIIGNDLQVLDSLAENIAAQMREIQGTRDVDISRGDPRPEFLIDLERERLGYYGLNARAVAQNIRNRIAGITPTQFSEEGEDYDITLKYAKQYRSSIEDIKNINLITPDGQEIKLSTIADIRQIYSPPRIQHIDRERAVTVTSGVYDTSIGEVMDQIRPYISDLDLPPNVNVEYGGEFEDQQEAFSDLFLILGVSIILVYIVMAGQFESFKDPFVIMFSIPFAFTGVLFALFFTGTNLSVIAFLGGVILVGIVVKNAIVLIDYVNLLRGRGEKLYDAIINGGLSRLRPVLMTTLTTILAMFPLALSTGEGAETWRPMAIAVIGGLAFSTLITLIIVPVMYAMIEKKDKEKQPKKELVST